MPVLAVLSEAIAAGPTGQGDVHRSRHDGSPIRRVDFGSWFRAACDKIGVPECTPHGLRHAGATRLLGKARAMSF